MLKKKCSLLNKKQLILTVDDLMFVRATFCSPNLCFDVLLLYLLVFRVRQAGWGIRKMRWLPLILTVANLLFVFIYLLVFGSERQVGGNDRW